MSKGIGLEGDFSLNALRQGKRIGVWTQLATRTNYSTNIYSLFEQAAADMEQAGEKRPSSLSFYDCDLHTRLIFGWSKAFLMQAYSVLSRPEVARHFVDCRC